MLTIRKSTLEFLAALSCNNNRDWFMSNRSSYLDSKVNFEEFVQEVIDKTVQFDPILKGLEARNCIFRINRDIRFSSDKSPYKSHLGAFIVRGGKKNGDHLAGYYFHIESGKSILAGGAYTPPTPWLTAIREKISEHPEEFMKYTKTKDFIRYFGAVEGEKLKTAPKGYSPDHPQIELLKLKSYLIINELSDKQVLDKDFMNHVINVFMAMKPFNDYLNDY